MLRRKQMKTSPKSKTIKNTDAENLYEGKKDV